MKRFSAKALTLAALVAAIATNPFAFGPGGARAETAGSKVVATVDGIPITEADLKLAEDEVGRDLGSIEGATKRRVLVEFLVENNLFAKAAEGDLQGILGYETRALVSSDFTNDRRSAIVDAQSTMVINGTQVKIYAWYDNEWGYACRLADITRMVASHL